MIELYNDMGQGKDVILWTSVVQSVCHLLTLTTKMIFPQHLVFTFLWIRHQKGLHMTKECPHSVICRTTTTGSLKMGGPNNKTGNVRVT